MAGKKKSSQNALRFRTDPEARLAYHLTQRFLATGVVPPALGELWLAADLKQSADDLCTDLLGFADASDEGLNGRAVGDLLDFRLDYLSDDGDGDACLYDIDRHDDDA